MCAAAQADSDSLMQPEDNRRMFDRIARRYDLMNQLMSLGLVGPWRRRAAAMLQPREGGRYLDVGCGTGDVAIEVLRQCPGSAVVGIDPSRQMLEVAAGKVRRAGLGDAVALMVARAEEMGFADGSFAGVISAFCIRNLADRAVGLRQMRRVLAPGGRAVVMELMEPPGRLLRLVYRASAGWLVPRAGRLIAGDRTAYQYLMDSIEAFGPPADVMRMMTDAGFSQVEHVPLHGGIAGVFRGWAD